MTARHRKRSEKYISIYRIRRTQEKKNKSANTEKRIDQEIEICSKIQEGKKERNSKKQEDKKERMARHRHRNKWAKETARHKKI